MRLSSILSLILVGWIVSILWAQGPPGPPPGRQHAKPNNKSFRFNGPSSQNNIPEQTFIVTSGWYFNREDALDDALHKAREKITGQLRLEEQKRLLHWSLNLDWSPNIAFVRQHLLTDLRKQDVTPEDVNGELEEFNIDGRYRAVEETRKFDLPEFKEGKGTRVCLKVVLNSENRKQIQKEIRLAEDQKRLKVTKSRMVFLVKFLVGIIALLVTACGYIRLDEWSKGYYTKWLRLAAVGCVAAVTLVLWKLVAYG